MKFKHLRKRYQWFFFSWVKIIIMEIKTENYPLAVVGAGSMGRGIAQVAASAGHPVMLYDIAEKHTQDAIEFIGLRLEDSFQKGKITENSKVQVLKNIKPVHALDELSQARLVVEAVSEDLEIKQSLFCGLESVMEVGAILSTNTSSLDLNKIVTNLKHPERFVGMHFFNPVPVMALVEIINMVETDPSVTKFVSKLVTRWGKIPVHVRNSPGFIVNRAARPFYGEALRIFSDGTTDAVTCDAIIRDCGSFRMGPFELMDLIGLDVNFEVNNQVWESFDRHPRFEPSSIQQDLVDAGKLGRKSGHGFYDYSACREIPNPENIPECDPPDSIIIEGSEKLPESLVKLLKTGTVSIKSTTGSGKIRFPGGGILVLSNGKSSEERSLENGDSVISMDLCLNFQHTPRVVLVADPNCSVNVLNKAAGLFQSFGKQVSVIKDVPGMVLTRMVAMLVNEASMLVEEEVADSGDINMAMKKGVNYPIGSLEWGELWGYKSVVETLENLFHEYGERYRVSTWLKQRAKIC